MLVLCSSPSDDLRAQVHELARALEKERQRVAFLEDELAASERFAKKLALELDEWKVSIAVNQALRLPLS